MRFQHDSTVGAGPGAASQGLGVSAVRVPEAAGTFRRTDRRPDGSGSRADIADGPMNLHSTITQSIGRANDRAFAGFDALSQCSRPVHE